MTATYPELRLTYPRRNRRTASLTVSPRSAATLAAAPHSASSTRTVRILSAIDAGPLVAQEGCAEDGMVRLMDGGVRPDNREERLGHLGGEGEAEAQLCGTGLASAAGAGGGGQSVRRHGFNLVGCIYACQHMGDK